MSVKPRCYVVGPISGRPELNTPAFERAKAILEGRGWDVTLPSEVVHPEAVVEAKRLGIGAVDAPEYRKVMRTLFRIVTEVQRLYVLPDWLESAGAKREVAVAHWSGVAIYEVEPEVRLHIQLMMDIKRMPGDES